MTIAYNSAHHAKFTGGFNGGTSGSCDTSGDNFLVGSIAYYGGGSPANSDFTDSKTNGNPTLGTAAFNDNDTWCKLFWWINPTVGTNHTVTVTKTVSLSSFGFSGYSGVNTSAPFDTQSAAAHASTTPGSITPSENDCLVVAAAGFSSSGFTSIDGGFTNIDNTPVQGGVNYGFAHSHLIQTTAAAANPAVTPSGTLMTCSIASFKAAAGGGGSTRPVKMAGTWGGYASAGGGFVG